MTNFSTLLSPTTYTLTFKVGTGALAAPDANGNQYPVTEPVTVTATLRPPSPRIMAQRFPGLPDNAIALQGRVVNATNPFFPDSVRAIAVNNKAVATTTYAGKAGRVEVELLGKNPFSGTLTAGERFYAVFKAS